MKKFGKENLLKALAGGVINLLKLEGANNYVLALITKDKTVFIPLIKNKDGYYAYIHTGYSIAEYELLESIVNTVFSEGTYGEMFKYKPIQRNIEFEKRVVSLVPSILGTNIKPSNLEAVLTENGYDISELHKELGFKIPERNYGELLKDPVVKERFEENKKSLTAVGATYEGLSLEAKIAHNSLVAGTANGIIFTGPTGTGKSFIARILADHDRAPLLSHQISYGTAIEDLIGMFVPNDQADISVVEKVEQIWNKEEAAIQEKFNKIVNLIKTKDSQTNWRFAAGPLFTASTKGYQLVLEEINFGQPGIISKINEFTDTTLYFTLNGEVYRKHPNFVIYMTMNPGYKGTEELNPALKNRFAIVDVPKLTKDQFIQRCSFYSQSLGHKLQEKFFDKLYDFTEFLKKEGNSSRWHENVEFSIRNAQRLMNTILQSPSSLEEFSAAMAVQYLNNLSIDNDNSEKLANLKKADDILKQIKEIYNYYDFAKLESVEVKTGFDELFTEAPDVPESAEDGMDDKYVDDLFSKF